MECWLSKCEASLCFSCTKGSRGVIWEPLYPKEKEISFWIEHYNDGRVEGGDEADIVCFVRNDRQ